MQYFMELRRGNCICHDIDSEKEKERDGQSARAGACGKLVGCIMYLSLYLVGNYFAIVMTFRYSVRYLRNAISLIYHPDLVFLAGHFVANADTCPASASVIDNRSPTSPSPLTFLGTTVPNCSHRITQVERTVADLINRLNSSKFVPPLNAFFSNEMQSVSLKTWKWDFAAKSLLEKRRCRSLNEVIWFPIYRIL